MEFVTRRAIRLPHNNIQAECPVEGDCRYNQITQGKMMRLTCGYLEKIIKTKRGLHVKCRNLTPCNT